MKKKKIIASCMLLTCLTLVLTGCGKEVTLKNGEKAVVSYKKGNITSDAFYKELKDKYGVAVLIDMIDHAIFDEAYKTDEEETTYVENQIAQMKSQYNNDEEKFQMAIQQYLGVKDEKELKSMLSLEYKRDKAINDAMKDSIKEDEINDYYENKTIGDIKVKHILIKPTTTDDMSAEEKEKAESEAKKKAEEIIQKLDSGKKFDSLAKKYSDDSATAEKGGELEYFNQDSNMDENFLKASIGLETGKYTKEPVKSTYGYHIILKVEQKEKPKLKDVKNNIIETLAKEKLSSDSSARYQALIDARESKGLEFKDDVLKKAYDDYMNQLIENAKGTSSN